jgi:acetyl esterase
MRVVAVCPRLAPEHPFPAAVDDSIAAFRDVASRAESFGIDARRLGIGGDSAGGNLSAVVGLATRGDAQRPALTLLIYPATDLTRTLQSHTTRGDGYLLTRESMAWYTDHYTSGGDVSLVDPRVSPLWEKDVSGAPRAIVVVAGFDPLVDEGVAYAQKLMDAKVETELMRFDALPHGFALMTGVVPAALEATHAIARRAGDALAGK